MKLKDVEINLQEIKEQKDDEKLELFIEKFDKDFNATTRKYIKETPLLNEICDAFSMELCEATPLYEKAYKLKKQIKEQLFKSLTDEQRLMVKQIEHCNETMLEDTEKQAIIYGYAMAVQLRNEAVNKYPLKKDEV